MTFPFKSRIVISASVVMLAFSVLSATLSSDDEIRLEGDYVGHLQDVWWDGGSNLWWAHTHQIVRTDPAGKVLACMDVEGHNAGLQVSDGRLYVAVCPMQSMTGGKTTASCHPQINVHDAMTLKLLERHVLEGVVDRIGSLAILPDRSFLVGCLRPQDIKKTQVRLHHLSSDYSLLKTIVLDDAEVQLGIETIKYREGELYLSLYKGKGLLIVLDAKTFKEKRRQTFNGTTGLVFDEDGAWCGYTNRDKITKRYMSGLTRCRLPDGP